MQLNLKQRTFSKPVQNFIKNNQDSEEFFAKIFSKKKDTTLIFEPGETACTDGQNIYVTPEFQNLYKNLAMFKKADNMLGYSKLYPKLQFPEPNRIYMISHALLIHECLHIIYTDFTINIRKDTEIKRKHKKIAAIIQNIIEDSYIEAAGAEQFKEIKYPLLFLRTICGLQNNQELQKSDDNENQSPLTRYLNYIINTILYPITITPEPKEDITSAIKKTLPLFYEAIKQPTGEKRYQYAKQILQILIDEGIADIEYNEDTGNGLPDPNTGTQGNPDNTQGEQQDISSDLFGRELTQLSNNTDTDNPQTAKEILEALKESIQNDESAQEILEDIVKEMEEASNSNINEKTSGQQSKIKKGENLDPVYNKNVTFKENTFIPQKENRSDYEEIKNNYKNTINKYKKFINTIKSRTTIKESGYRYGNSINSSKLNDPKKRYWQRNSEDLEMPELAVSLIIDGSGSMWEKRTQAAQKAAIILHEVLDNALIPHRIAEFRSYQCDAAEHNILVDFKAKANDKYNIMKLDGNGGNRDGLALRWALKDILKQPQNDKIIIVISDGQPSAYDKYENAIADMKDVQKKAKSKKVSIIAIALEETYIYKELQEYYKTVLYCPNLEKLPETLAKIIAKELAK